MWQHWVNALLGLWIIVLAFLGMSGGTLTWTLVITGLVVAVLALWGAYGTSDSREEDKMMGRMQHQ